MGSVIGYQEAHGPVATFETDVAGKIKNLVVDINPVQSGTGDPSPDNVRPITGWTGAKVTKCGKNLLDISKNESGGIDATGAYVNGYIFWRSSVFIPCVEGQSYTLSTQKYPNWTMRIYFYDSDHNFIIRHQTNGSVTQTAPTGASYIKWSIYKANVAFTREEVEASELQLEKSSTATEYEPYVGSTYDITFPSEAGTVYGGTLDVVKGELVVDRAMVDLGTLTWTLNPDTGANANVLNYGLKAVASQNVQPNIIASNYTTVTRNQHASAISDGTAASLISQSNYGNYIYVGDASFTPSGQLIYELATPITYQLTPQEVRTIIGTNTIYADTGDTSVIYPKTITPVETVSNVSLMELRRNIIAAQANDNLYDKWVWKQEKNDFVVRSNTVGFLEGLGNNIYADQRSDRENNRRSIVAKRGNVSFVAYDSVSGGSYTPVKLYPIPIPPNATSVQMSCDNDAQDLLMGAMLLRLENGVYKQIQPNTYTIDISRPLWLITGNHHYLAPYIQYGDNSNFATNELENVQFAFSRIGALRWTLTGEDVVIRKRNIKWNSNGSYISFASENNVNNYLAVVTRRGLCGYASHDGSALNNESPIPIPPTATKVTVTTTPTLQAHLILLKCFDNQTQQLITDNSWKSSPVTMTFDAADNLELAVALRVDSSASDFTTSTTPTEIIIQFE